MAMYYEPLDVENYEIRMLSILPATNHDSIMKCTLEKTSLIGPTKYVALSYCWGDPGITTKMFVNDIEVTVTVNLADALQQLRLLGVTRVWADALCINQSDRQEKSLQIRYMKHVYSKEDETYSWLGRDGADSSKAAMLFLQKLLLTEDSGLPKDFPNEHTPGVNCKALQATAVPIISEALRPMSIDESLNRADDCKRCLYETNCRALVDLFRIPYWKRRWIIQEIAVSPRVQIICDGMRMTLEDMKAAIRPCRKSCYWNSETETAYSFIDRILQFRHDCQAGMKPSLCKSIAMTRESLSADPRDSIFALLGICHDGPELVPTPNYQQPLEAIVLDISRSLLRKKNYLEVVLINRLLEIEGNPAPLPSWIQNGVTTDITENSYALVNKRLASWGKLCILDMIGEISYLFQAQGVIIGTIVAATSIIGSGGNNSDESPSGIFEGVLLADQSTEPTAYYASNAEIVAALFSCLTEREDLTSGRRRHILAKQSDRESGFSYHMRAHIVWHAVCLYLAGCDIPRWSRLCLPLNCCYLSRRKRTRVPECLESGKDNLVTHGLLVQWFEANANFLVQGRVLKDWAKRWSFGTLVLRWIDSVGCLIFVWGIPCLVLVFSILYQDQVVHTSEDTLIGILIPLSFLSSFQIVALSLYRGKVFRLLHKIWANMPHILKKPKKLVRSDKGAIGMACVAAEPGDKICLLAGRTTPLVLREVGSGDRVRYVVVGDIYVYMSGSDRKLYNGFIDQQTDSEVTGGVHFQEMRMRYAGMPKPWGSKGRSEECVNSGERARCINRYRKEGILETFNLV